MADEERYVVSIDSSANYTFCCWSLSTGKTIATKKKQHATSIAAFPSDDEIVVSTATVTEVLSLPTLEVKSVLDIGEGEAGANCLSYSPDGRWLAAGRFRHMHLFSAAGYERVEMGTMAASADCHSGDEINVLNFTPSSDKIAAGTSGGDIAAWRVPSLEQLFMIPSPDRGLGNLVISLLFLSDSVLANSYHSHDMKKIFLWNAEDGAPVKQLTNHRHRVLSMALSPDGKTFASGSNDCVVLIFDAATYKCKKYIDMPSIVMGMCFASNDILLASNISDSILSVNVKTTKIASLSEIKHRYSRAIAVTGARKEGLRVLLIHYDIDCLS